MTSIIAISSPTPLKPRLKSIGLISTIKKDDQNTIRSNGPRTYQVKPLQSVKRLFISRVSGGFSMGA